MDKDKALSRKTVGRIFDNSRVHIWVSKPFPIRIYLYTDKFSWYGQLKKISMPADPFKLDWKAARRVVSIQV